MIFRFTFLKAFLLFMIVALAATFASSPSDTVWTKTYGGTNIDIVYGITQTTDGGYAMTGYTRSFGAQAGHNIWLFKTDANGNLLWNVGFGGSGDDEAYSIQQTTDGGYIVTGFTKSFGAGGNDLIVVKFDSAGTEEWLKTWGGTSDEEGYWILQTPDHGYIVAGATSSFGNLGSRDAWVIKMDSVGTEQWKKVYGGYGSDGARSIQPTSDGGYIISGWTFSNGASSVGSCWLLKITSDGTEQWDHFFGGSDADRGYFAEQTTDGGYIVTGYSGSYGAGLYDMLLIKTDASGTAQWKKYFGGTGRDYGSEVHQTPDGGYIVGGYTLSFGAGSEDFWLVKTDSVGTKLWDKTYGGTSTDVCNTLKITPDGGFIAAGYTLSYGAGVHDGWVIKTEATLPVELVSFTGSYFNCAVNLSWTTATESNNKGFDIQRIKSNGNWETIGYIQGQGTSTIKNEYSFSDKNVSEGTYKYRLKQTDFDGSNVYSKEIEVNTKVPESFSVAQNYPNPFNPSTTIEYSIAKISQVSIKIYDVLGKELQTLVKASQEAGTYKVTWNANNYGNGIYFYKVEAGNLSKTGKMILMK
jgi:hypothetical protein